MLHITYHVGIYFIIEKKFDGPSSWLRFFGVCLMGVEGGANGGHQSQTCLTHTGLKQHGRLPALTQMVYVTSALRFIPLTVRHI